MLDNKYFEIFNRLGDELSRDIFIERLKFSFSAGFLQDTSNVDWVSLMRKSVPDVFLEWDALINRIRNDEFSDAPCYIFGASNCGKVVLEELGKENVLKNLNLCGFVDNFKTGIFQELPIVSPTLISTKSMIIIANTVKNHSCEILKQLLEIGFNNAYHFLNHGILYGREYFDLFSHYEDEIFVDAGCYDGETAISFINWCKGSYKQIYAFEAVASSYEACKKALSEYENVILINKGIFDHNGETQIFIGDGQPSCNAVGDKTSTANSWVEYTQQQTIEICKLDDALNGVKPTFIKMGIEGSEIPAVYGAKEIIKKHKPRLAISVYHRPQDILEIPMLLLEFNPNYKLYLRHYSPFNAETDLYAVDGEAL